MFYLIHVRHNHRPCKPQKCDAMRAVHGKCSLHGLILMIAIRGYFQAGKAAANTVDFTTVRTKGVVDDLKQSKVARCGAVHTQLHHYCLWKRTKQGGGVQRMSDGFWTSAEVLGRLTMLPGRPDQWWSFSSLARSVPFCQASLSATPHRTRR